MAWSPDGKHIVLGTKSDIISQVDVESQTVTKPRDMGREVSRIA